MRKLCSCDNGRIGNLHTVMGFILFLQAAQNSDGVFNRRLIDKHFLEAAFKRSVLFDVLAVFVERRRANHMKFTAGECGFKHIARIHAALGFAGADNRMNFVDEENDFPFLSRHFLKELLQTLFKLTAVLRTGNQTRHIERENHLVAQGIGHFIVDDSLSKAFHDGRFTDTRFADQHGVVFRAALQNLHRAANFVITADHRIKLALTSTLGEVNRVFLERFTLIFRVGIVGFVRTAHGFDGLFHCTACKPGLFGQTSGFRFVLGKGKQRHFRRNVFVARLHGLFFREVQEVHQVARNLNIAALPRHFGQTVNGILHVTFEASDIHAGALEQTARRPFRIGEQSGEQVQGFHELIVMSQRNRLRTPYGILKLRR